MADAAARSPESVDGRALWGRRFELAGQVALAAIGVAFPAALGWVPGWADGRATVDASLSEVLLVVPCLLLLPLAATALALRRGKAEAAWALPFLFFGGFVLLGLLQMVPLPQGIHSALSPGFDSIAQRYWPAGAPGPEYPRPLSLDTRSTLLAVLRLSAAFSCLLAAFAFVRSAKDATRVLLPQAAAAGVVSFLSLLKSGVVAAWGPRAIQSVSFMFPLGSSGARASGPFINANQLAGYLEIAFPVVVALMLLPGCRQERDGERRTGLLKLRDPRQVLLATCALLVAGAVLASQSRLGILGFVAGAALMAVLLMRGLAVRARTVYAGGALVLSFFVYLGLEPVLNRYAILAEQEVDRLEAWEMGVAIAKDFPVLGTGMGTFHRVSPAYTPPSLKYHYFQTHNDYLNVASDAGVVGLALLAAAVFAWAWLVWKGLRSADRSSMVLAAASLACAGAMAMHSVGDFNLQVGAIMFHMALSAGVGLAAARMGATPPAAAAVVQEQAKEAP